MAAVLEYVSSEMLEIAGQICVDGGKKLIMPKHLNLGLRSDANIHEALVKKKGAKKSVEPVNDSQ